MRIAPEVHRPIFLLDKQSSGASAIRLHKALSGVGILLFALTTAFAQDYTKIVVFGDSLSDTGNVAHLTQAKYGVRIPGPVADYANGRFTDGRYTVPAAKNFFGVWVDQLAASLPARPQVRDSLDGGTNYAYGFATTGNGSSPLDLTPTLSVQVANIGQQISNYLATHPKIDSHTLFIVWGGAIDVLNATSANDVIDSAVRQSLNLQRLIDAGATQFIVPNLPPLGSTPRLNGSPTTSAPATVASALFNSWLATGISVVRDFNWYRRLTIYQLNIFGLFEEIAASPSHFSLTNITAMSQGNPTANPDTYLFWDEIHPTTRGHNIISDAAIDLIAEHRSMEASSGISAVR